MSKKRILQLAPHFQRYQSSIELFKEYFNLKVRLHNEIIEDFSFYACPLCLKEFLLQTRNVIANLPSFTLDHVPQESVGGKYKIITCKYCNNNAGSSYEYALGDLMDYRAFLEGYKAVMLKGKLIIKDENLSINSSLQALEIGSLMINMGKGYAIKPLEEWIKSKLPGTKVELSMSIRKPNQQKIALSLLKSAYLICFANWGYDFVLSDNAKNIRECLAGNKQYPVQIPFFSLEKYITSEDMRQKLEGICFLWFQSGIKCFVVNMTLLNPHTKIPTLASVVIPSESNKGWEDIEWVGKNKHHGDALDFRIETISPSFFLNKELNGYQLASKVLRDKEYVNSNNAHPPQ